MSLARSWVDGYPLTIIGVSRAGFDGTDPGSSPQIRVPIMMEAQLSPQFAEFYSLKNRRGNPIIEGHVWVYINLGNNHEANRPFDEQYGSHLRDDFLRVRATPHHFEELRMRPAAARRSFRKCWSRSTGPISRFKPLPRTRFRSPPSSAGPPWRSMESPRRCCTFLRSRLTRKCQAEFGDRPARMWSSRQRSARAPHFRCL